MELWIRSQDKEILTTVQHLDIYDASVENEKCFVIEESGTDLGSYETYERALEVLDEIQSYIRNTTSIKHHRVKHDGIYQDFDIPFTQETRVYEMPK